MKIIQDSVPQLTLTDKDGFVQEIKSVRYFDETEDRVVLRCAEFVKSFVRGYTCNLVCNYSVGDLHGKETENQTDLIADLLLVYANKSWSIDGYPEFEYIFYK